MTGYSLKFDALPKKDRKGRNLEVENARIKSVSLSNEDHGHLTAWLQVEFKSGGCGFGGYALGQWDGGNLKEGEGNYAAEFIVRCITTVLDGDGFGKWEDLAGKPIRILHGGWGGTIVAVGHFVEDKWFCPSQEFASKVEDS